MHGLGPNASAYTVHRFLWFVLSFRPIHCYIINVAFSQIRHIFRCPKFIFGGCGFKMVKLRGWMYKLQPYKCLYIPRFYAKYPSPC